MIFAKLNRPTLRKLAPGESVSEHGITYTRLDGDGRWSVNVMVSRVRHHVVVGLESQGFTRTQAEELVAKLKAKKREVKHGVPSKLAPRAWSLAAAVPDYIEYLRTHDGKDIDAKERRFEQHIVPAMGKLHLASITEDDWKRYVASRKREGAAPGTINRERSALLHLLNTARRRKQIAAVPCELDRQPEPPGKLVYLTPAQAQALLRAAEEDQSPNAHRFVMIAMFTGMRHESILNLRARDVEASRLVIWVGDDKAGRREQPMPSVLAEYLREVVKSLRPDEFIFASRRAKSGRAYQINSVFRRCVDRAGLSREVTPHTMRHTTASNAAQAGLDAATIQAMHGWKTRQMAERYTHAASLSGAMDRLEARLTGSNVTQKLQASTARKR